MTPITEQALVTAVDHAISKGGESDNRLAELIANAYIKATKETFHLNSTVEAFRLSAKNLSKEEISKGAQILRTKLLAAILYSHTSKL